MRAASVSAAISRSLTTPSIFSAGTIVRSVY
jgi:hypothetical protein